MKTLYCPTEPLLGSMLMLPQSSINYIAIFILAMLIISMKNGFPQTMNHGFYWSHQTIKKLWAVNLVSSNKHLTEGYVYILPASHCTSEPGSCCNHPQDTAWSNRSLDLHGLWRTLPEWFHLASFLWELLWIRGSLCLVPAPSSSFLWHYSLILKKLYQLFWLFMDLFICHLYFRVGRSCLPPIT